jgi:hypothetical protein
MDCASSLDWIWSTEAPWDEAPADVDLHLRVCAECRAERRARLQTSRALRRLRAQDETPPAAADMRVLASAAAAARAAPAGRVAGGPRWSVASFAAVAAVLLLTLGVGFVTGRASVPVASTPAPSPPAALPRAHAVGLSRGGLAAFADGQTYLLAGPAGGPYEVVGAVHFGAVDLRAAHRNDELVVAVGPDAVIPGENLSAHDLGDMGMEILGRRAVASR